MSKHALSPASSRGLCPVTLQSKTMGPAVIIACRSPRQIRQLTSHRPVCCTSGPISTAGQPSRRMGRIVCLAGGSGSDTEDERLPDGTRVKVKQSLTVFHAPKQKEGIDLKGMEGELVGWVDQYKGKVLSSNLPARIKFKLDVGGKEKPFFAHLADDEFEAA